MNRVAIRCLRLLCAVLLLGLGVGASPVQQVSAAADEKYVLVILTPLVDIYVGDTVTLPYIMQSAKYNRFTLAPLTPGEAQATAQLGSVAVTPDGMGGAIVYTAQKAGDDEIVVTATNAVGSAQGSVTLHVKEKPNYDLSFVLVTEASSDAGGAFRGIFSGEGEFANTSDSPIEGQGTADFWFSLWLENEALQCKLDPPVQGHSPFKISGEPDPIAPLVPAPGFIEGFTLDLKFDPMQLNGSAITCQGLGGLGMTYPWPGTTASGDDYNMNGYIFPGEGGIYNIATDKTWGYVQVTRKDQ